MFKKEICGHFFGAKLEKSSSRFSILSSQKIRSKLVSKKEFKSLAKPNNERQSPLFGVNSISNISSFISCSCPSWNNLLDTSDKVGFVGKNLKRCLNAIFI